MKSLDGNPEMKTQVKYSTQVEKEIFLTNNPIIKLWTRSFGSSSFVAFVCSKISPSWTCCVVPLFELCRLVEIDEVTVLILMIPGEICSDTFLLHYRDSRLVCKFLAIFRSGRASGNGTRWEDIRKWYPWPPKAAEKKYQWLHTEDLDELTFDWFSQFKRRE